MSRRRALDIAQLLAAASSVLKKNAGLQAQRFNVLKQTTGASGKRSPSTYPKTRPIILSQIEHLSVKDERRDSQPVSPGSAKPANLELSELSAAYVATESHDAQLTPIPQLEGLSNQFDLPQDDRFPVFASDEAREHGADDGRSDSILASSPESSAVHRQQPNAPTIDQRTSEARTEEEAMLSQLIRSPKVLELLHSDKSSPSNEYPRDRQSTRSPVTADDQAQPQDQVLPSREPSEKNPDTNSTLSVKSGGSLDLLSKIEGLPQSNVKNTESTPSITPAPYQLRESKVPSSRFGRLWQYGGLASSMAFGAMGESLRRVTSSSPNSSGSAILSDANMERLVSKLSRMRGAALKLGQMISFQDLKMLPGPIQEVLQRVQDSADFMPVWQRDRVLAQNLGSEWRDLFSSFDEVPLAAASIGQVHGAVMKENGQPVAVKVQYPGVAQSIDSDLKNLSSLLIVSRLLPKGLYLDRTIENARTELAWECDYKREADAARRFSEFLADDTDTFTVPKVIEQASSDQVLTLERMNGTAVAKISSLSQEQKDWIASNILRLCLREIFEFRFMQTDPNWTNFLYNSNAHKIELLDFGASRGYPKKFIDPYLEILEAASRGDRETIAERSVLLGYLTGHESTTMRDAHVDSVLTLAEPFADSGPEMYDFRDQTITDRVRALIPVMLRERLAPPPEETYSLHRKLSGAFLLCARLGSRVPAKQMFKDAVQHLKGHGT